MSYQHFYPEYIKSFKFSSIIVIYWECKPCRKPIPAKLCINIMLSFKVFLPSSIRSTLKKHRSSQLIFLFPLKRISLITTIFFPSKSDITLIFLSTKYSPFRLDALRYAYGEKIYKKYYDN